MSPVQVRSAPPNRSHVAAVEPSVRDLDPRDDLALLTCAEMARADAAAIAAGVPGIDLMEAAGRAVLPPSRRNHARQPVVVLCAPATMVATASWRAASPGKALAGTPGPARRAWRVEGDAAWASSTWDGEVVPLSLDLLGGRPLVIDALFGAGLTRPIAGVAGQLIDRINTARRSRRSPSTCRADCMATAERSWAARRPQLGR